VTILRTCCILALAGLAFVFLWGEFSFSRGVDALRALALVLPGPYLFVLVSHPPGDLARSFGALLSGKKSGMSRETALAGASIFRALGAYAFAIGALGTVIASWKGMVEIVGARGMPEMEPMLPWLAHGCLLFAFGVFLRWMLYTPLASVFEAQRKAGEGNPEHAET
jgi:hypothetical protein